MLRRDANTLDIIFVAQMADIAELNAVLMTCGIGNGVQRTQIIQNEGF